MNILQGIPNPSDLETILSEVNETESKKVQCVELLKEWIKCQPHLPFETYDELLLDKFLRGCKFNMERTKRKLDMYFTIRTLYPEFYHNRDPSSSEALEALKIVSLLCIPQATPSGGRITVYRLNSSDSAKFEPVDVIRNIFMFGDIRLREEPPVINDVYIFDANHNLTPSHAAKLTVTLIKKALFCVQNAYPLRLKEVHVIHAPSLVEKLVNLFRMFVNEKVRDRFHLHANYESLHDFIPRSHLPKDYGGDLPEISELQELWIKKLLTYKKYFEEQENVKSDESKRLEKQKILENDVYGCEGSFRKLNVD